MTSARSENTGISQGVGPIPHSGDPTNSSPAARVVHVNDQVEGAVYIGRNISRRWPAQSLKGGLWSNHFRVNKWGREVAIQKYKESLLARLAGEAGAKWGDELTRLREKPLACWCRHDGENKTEANACHGDVLIELLARYTDDELKRMAGGPE